MTALALRPYQEEALDRIDAARARGVRSGLGVAATGLGKAQPIDEPVLTPLGWRLMGDLRPGQQVIGSDGRPTTITGVYPQGVRPVVRVRFSDGAEVRADPEHLWAVRDKHDVYRGRPWRILRTSDLDVTRRWRVPLPAPIEHTDNSAELPLDPYLLGVLLGDGGLSVTGRVLLHTEHALAATLDLPAPCNLTLLRDDGPARTAGTYIIGGPTGRGRNPVLSAIRALGLEGSHATTKRVPLPYLVAATEARLDLLHGIMDADGHVRDDGHVEITLANQGLIADVASLVRSLGGTARTTERRTRWTHDGQVRTGTAWRLSIALAACPFRWKADRWTPRDKYQPARHITSIDPAGEAECVCISVDAPDQLYVTTDYVVTHNTVMFCSLAERWACRTLVVAHRDELIEQAAAKVAQIWPGASVGVVKGPRDELGADVVVASVQTLAQTRRLLRLPTCRPGYELDDGGMFHVEQRLPPFGLVVVDEAHHSAADSYRAVLDHLGCGRDRHPDAPWLLGVTATPDRGDKRGLDDIYDEIVWSYDLTWGIRAGYLSDLRGVRVELADLDLGQVKVSRGDYQAGDAGRALVAAGVSDAVVRAWQAQAAGRPTLVFTATVAQAQEQVGAFLAAGVRAAWVSGELALDERRSVLDRFAAGDLDVVANCAVLTEGYDNPAVSCVVVARPTKSRALYVQMVGRGTRLHPEKDDALVIDVVGASAEHSLVTAPSLFGLDPRDARNGAARLGEAAAARDEEAVRAGRLTMEEVNLFASVRARGKIAWVDVHRPGDLRRYQRSLPPTRDGEEQPTVVLAQREPDPADVWTAGLLWRDGTKRVLLAEVPMDLAQGAAEEYVRRTAGTVASVDARWRSRPPTARQLAAAKKWGITVEPGWSAGDVSDAIDRRAARRRSSRRPRVATPS